jgi:tyrosine-protein phosphatase YwqE
MVNSDLSSLKTDFHSHLLPGVDDGAKTFEDSLHLIQGLLSLGIEQIITTPHLHFYSFPHNSSDSLRRIFDTFYEDIIKELPHLNLSLGAEHMLDDNFLNILRENKVLPVFNNHLLIELGYKAPPPNLHEILFEIQIKGFVPIIAHPERYLYYAESIEHFQQLKEWGAHFQMNLSSLTGYYGQNMNDLALQLIAADLIDYFSSDLHHQRQLDLITQGSKEGLYQKVFQQTTPNNLAIEI